MLPDGPCRGQHQLPRPPIHGSAVTHRRVGPRRPRPPSRTFQRAPSSSAASPPTSARTATAHLSRLHLDRASARSAPTGTPCCSSASGACTLTASVAQGTHYLAATGNNQTFPVGPAARGYWLVGSDGGIFSFGAADFHGSMGGTPLQRPVVGITPTATRAGYWLVASDGGIFSFGDSPSTAPSPASASTRPDQDCPTASMPRSSAWCRPSAATATSWSRPTAASLPSATPNSRGPAPGSAAVLRYRRLGHARQHGNGLLARHQHSGASTPSATRPSTAHRTPSSVPVVNAVATPDWHGLLVALRERCGGRLWRRHVLGRPARLRQPVQPGNGHLPDCRRQGLLGRLGTGRRLRLRRRALPGERWPPPASTAPSSPPSASEGYAPSASSRGGGSSATTASMTVSIPRATPLEARARSSER